MKLVTKISLAATVSLLLFSQVILWYLLAQSDQIVMESKATAEVERLNSSAVQLEKALTKIGKVEEEIETIVVRACFREIAPVKSAVYCGDQEIWNGTSYEFSTQQFWKSNPQKREDTGIYYVRTTVNNTPLLLLEQEIPFQGKKYAIFQYLDLSDMSERLRTLFCEGMAVSLAVIAVMNVILRMIVKRILYPFYELKQAANVISSGRYEERVSIHSKDEIGDLAKSFNQMAEKVQLHIDELSQLNESQSRMMGSLAHELKTPMTAIQGYAETLLRVRLPEERKIRALQYIESECKRLSRLSAKMLELTGLYHAEGSLNFETISVIPLFEEAVQIFQVRLDQKEITAHIERPHGGDAEVWLEGDRDLLMTVLLNCLENAWRASEEKSSIVLGAEENAIWIQDFGRGIPKEEITRLTEAFYMVDRSRTRKEGGAGLGLALCEQIAKLHGMELSIESEEGEGTRVTLNFEAQG